jgi:hypothetical protein
MCALTQPSIDFVTFHTTDAYWETHVSPHVCTVKPAQTHLLEFFVKSVRRSNPKGRAVLLTDITSAIPDVFDRVSRHEVHQPSIMLDRFRAQLKFLLECPTPSHKVFMDSDTLVLTDLRSVFDEPFDLGVTIRDNALHPWERDMPYNMGVIFVNTTRLRNVCLLYDELIHRVERMEPDLWAWAGNQIAIRDFMAQQDKLNAIHVAVFPCSIYNYTPRTTSESVSERRILHFAGAAKTMMIEFALQLGIK